MTFLADMQAMLIYLLQTFSAKSEFHNFDSLEFICYITRENSPLKQKQEPSQRRQRRNKTIKHSNHKTTPSLDKQNHSIPGTTNKRGKKSTSDKTMRKVNLQIRLIQIKPPRHLKSLKQGRRTRPKRTVPVFPGPSILSALDASHLLALRDDILDREAAEIGIRGRRVDSHSAHLGFVHEADGFRAHVPGERPDGAAVLFVFFEAALGDCCREGVEELD